MVEELERIRTRALEAAAVANDPELPHNERLAAAFDAIRAASREALRAATAEVKIGVAGVMNAGKSLLINTLLGRADLLPVKDGPQTGNVTMLRLVPEDELRTTRDRRVQDRVLRQRGCAGLLNWFIDKAREGRAAGLDEGRLRELPATPVSAESRTVWRETSAWAENAWSNPNIGLRNLIRELVRFLRALSSPRTGVCNGKPLEIEYAKATQWLGLPQSTDPRQRVRQPPGWPRAPHHAARRWRFHRGKLLRLLFLDPSRECQGADQQGDLGPVRPQGGESASSSATRPVSVRPRRRSGTGS